MTRDGETAVLRVRRSDGFVSYEVPLGEVSTVLDAVRYAAEHEDPDLAFRYNCGSGRCGSCSAEVDGEPVLMCTEPMEGDVTVEPMETFPTVKDLVTDVSSQWDTARSLPGFRARDDAERYLPRDAEDVAEFERCIECFLCQDVCHILREHDGDYVGPRFITRLAALNRHPLDGRDRAEWAAEESGLFRCNVTRCCQETCPEDIRITDEAIVPERERVVDRLDPVIGWLRRLLG